MNDRKQQKSVRKNITATVKFFDEAKGFGFVSPADGSPDAFIHISVLQGTSYSDLSEGMKIVCDLVAGDRGPQVSAIHEPEDGAAPSASTQDAVVEGIVVTYVPEHRYGFVAPEKGGRNIFFHTNMLERSEVDMENFGIDARVKCEVRMGIKGPIADTLEVLE